VGASGRDLLAALLEGDRAPAVLADLARGKLRATLPDVRRAWVGRVNPHHLVRIERILAHIDFLEQSIAQVQEEIDRCLSPCEDAVVLRDGITGVGRTAAAALIAEIGVDMERFPTDKHRPSWAGVCPGNKQSGGKRLSGKTPKGHPWLRAVLGEVVGAIAHSPGTYLYAQYQRIARRRGKHKAIVAVAHSVLVIAYHILKDKRPYNDWGADYFDKRDTARIQRHPVQRLEHLGFTVTLTPKEAA
jgi:transposase